MPRKKPSSAKVKPIVGGTAARTKRLRLKPSEKIRSRGSALEVRVGPAKMGAPSKYDERFVAVAKQMAKVGATDSEIAAAMGVSLSTLNYWRAAHPEFLAALREGKDAFDERIEKSLAHRALGYTYDAEEIKMIDDVVVRVPIKKHVPPDVTACIFWLKNRRPDEWRDVNQTNHVPVPLEAGQDVRIEIERRVISIAARLREEEGPRLVN